MTSDAHRSDVFAEERQEHIARIVEEQGAPGSRTWRRCSCLRGHDPQGSRRRSRRAAASATHGGAIEPVRERPERAFDVRERLQRNEKDAIGAAAAAMVQDGESIALDASTTALVVARHLKARGGWSQLTVITNGLRIA